MKTGSNILFLSFLIFFFKSPYFFIFLKYQANICILRLEKKESIKFAMTYYLGPERKSLRPRIKLKIFKIVSNQLKIGSLKIVFEKNTQPKSLFNFCFVIGSGHFFSDLSNIENFNIITLEYY